MLASTSILALMSIIGLASAVPTPVELAPRCGTTIYPSFLQQLSESAPYTVGPNTLNSNGNFHVSQTVGADGKVTNRIYQVIAFSGIPSNAYQCELKVKFDANYPITSYGTPTLNVTTLYRGSPASIAYPNDYSWSKFFPSGTAAFGPGLFDTITFAPGQVASINSGVCASSLAYVFSIASWVSQSASVDFAEYFNKLNGAGLNGVFLTHSC